MTEEERKAAQDTFIEAFQNSGIVMVGARAAGIHRTLVDYWNEHDTHGFSGRYGQAKLDANDRLRAEIYRRGVQGVERTENVYWHGEVIGTKTITEYSDTLLIFLSKARMPEFRDKITLTVDLQDRIRQIAAEQGDDPEKVLREAEALLKEWQAK